MKSLFTLLAFFLLFGSSRVFSQQSPEEAKNCKDIVYLKNGSVFRGKITEMKPGGDLVMTTWSGIIMTLPENNVKRIVQRCRDQKKSEPKLYNFKEKGLYNATRLGVLIGQNYLGSNSTGYSLYHSTGWMFHRRIGAGIGLGVETFNPDGRDATTYPIFAEVRGYFRAKNVTPFYSVTGGWAFTGKNGDSEWGFINDWKGGWLAKAQFGYRIGNNFTLFGGLSLQKKTLDWRSAWGNEWGTDQILHKRFELGFGIIL
ncbi:MAG: hypothetical protein IPJ82_07390 [Lewinellaceae bacterium]|nr:hypothetical protein [Lewinellaceae bacterium]